MTLLIGSSTNQLPTSGELGTMAFQDALAPTVGAQANVATNIRNIKPSLMFDFSNSQTVDGRIYCNRSSIASSTTSNGVIRYVPQNTPRIEYDLATGDCKGLLVEEQRTNLVTYSTDITSSYGSAVYVNWNVASYNANTLSAPDMTNTADEFVAQSPTASRVWRISVTAGETYTFSCYVRRSPYSTSDNAIEQFGFLWANSTNGTSLNTYGTQELNLPAGAKGLTNYWQRVWFSYTVPAGITSIEMGISNRGSGTGNQNYSVGVWGFQLELGSYPTSYIPTNGAAATRAADNISVKLYDGYNSPYGTVAAYAIIDPVTYPGKKQLVYTYGNSFNDGIQLSVYNRSTDYTMYNSVYKTIDCGTDRTVFTGGVIKTAAAYGPKRASSFATNGMVNTLASLDGGYTAPSKDFMIQEYMTIGSQYYSGSWSTWLNGCIRRIAFYPYMMTNDELAEITK